MKLLAFGAHPDDVELGMGGTIARYSQRKHDVMVVTVTIPSNKEIRRKECEVAAELLGVELLIIDIEPNGIVFSRELVGVLEKIINDFSPDEVYTHWNHDSHQDHVAISNATFAAARKNDCSLYMYEQQIPGGVVPYGFKAQMFVDISNSIDTKVESCLAHKSQMEDPWIDALEGRARYRGFQSNVKYAEAFEVVREIKEI